MFVVRKWGLYINLGLKRVFLGKRGYSRELKLKEKEDIFF